MRKSQEQIENEIGFYAFTTTDRDYLFRQKLESKTFYNFFCFKERHNVCVINKFLNVEDIQWRKHQTDWRSITDLVIYDRFGSKLSGVKGKLEIKHSDVGMEHFQLVESFGKAQYDKPFYRQNYKRIKYLENLYPPKFYL